MSSKYRIVRCINGYPGYKKYVLLCTTVIGNNGCQSSASDFLNTWSYITRLVVAVIHELVKILIQTAYNRENR